MKRRNLRTKTAAELAKALGLSPADAVEISVRSAINTKIINEVTRAGITHAHLAELAGTARTRITAIMNRNTQNVSTDLLLRILGALGVTAKVSFSRAA